MTETQPPAPGPTLEGATDLVLVRHGQTEWNRVKRVQGRSDIPLNDTGREQARAAGERLAGRGIAAVAASPLSRALDTARIIADAAGIADVEVVDELIERDYGESEGMTGDDIRARFGGSLEARESRRATAERVTPALLALADRHPGERVLVVTHGGVIGSLVRVLTRWAWPEGGARVDNGSDHLLRVRDGRLSLVSFDGRAWSDDLLPPVEPSPAQSER